MLELRINYGPGYRVYYFRSGQAVVVLLCGGDKSTQDEDIDKAIAYKSDYMRRLKKKECETQ
jgi:putative addiction module killer protein